MKSFILLFVAIIGINAQAMPAQILILRHGEKPDQGPILSPKGFQRANALPAFFHQSPIATQFGPPAAVFAANPAEPGDAVRSIQTCTPTAASFNLPVDHRFNKYQVGDIAKAIFTNPALNGRTVIICWVHSQIPQLAAALGVRPVPPAWDDKVFDRIWQLSYSNNGVQIRDIPQRVLPGDSLR